MKLVGRMRCPRGAVVSVASGKPVIVDESVRCPGSGPVFVNETVDTALYVHCEECCKGDLYLAADAGLWRPFLETKEAA